MREAFEKVDLEHKQDKPVKEKTATTTTAGAAYPRGGGGAPEPGIMQEATSTTTKTSGPGVVSILEPAAAAEGPESGSQLPDAPPPSASTPATNPQKLKAKPHPIQGGRQGPIGLAFPPPIQESKPKLPPATSRADEAGSWRQTKPKEQQRPKPVPGQSKSDQKPASSRPPKSSQGPQNNATLPPKPAAPEPRVRKEVRVKQGGANDVSSLASRVKNLVLDSASPRKSSSGGPAKTSTGPTTTTAPTQEA